MIKSRFGVICWYMFFLPVSAVCGFYDDNTGIVVFIVTCVILPFYFCHFLSGYLDARMGYSFKGNLLINFEFLKFIKSQKFAESDISDAVDSFFLWYGLAIFCLIFAFIIR